MVRGGGIIDIKTTPTVVLSTGLVLDPDEFFNEEQVVGNIAAMLGISPNNIRVTNIVRETNRRKRSSRNNAADTREDAPGGKVDIEVCLRLVNFITHK